MKCLNYDPCYQPYVKIKSKKKASRNGCTVRERNGA